MLKPNKVYTDNIVSLCWRLTRYLFLAKLLISYSRNMNSAIDPITRN